MRLTVDYVPLNDLIFVVNFVNKYYSLGRWRYKRNEYFYKTTTYCFHLLYVLDRWRRFDFLTGCEECLVLRFLNFQKNCANDLVVCGDRIKEFFLSYKLPKKIGILKNFLYDNDWSFLEMIPVWNLDKVIKVLDFSLFDIKQVREDRQPKKNLKYSDLWVSVFGYRFIGDALLVRFKTSFGFYFDSLIDDVFFQRVLIQNEQEQVVFRINARFSRCSKRIDLSIPIFIDVWVYD